jgi:hypothetical protein
MAGYEAEKGDKVRVVVQEGFPIGKSGGRGRCGGIGDCAGIPGLPSYALIRQMCSSIIMIIMIIMIIIIS